MQTTACDKDEVVSKRDEMQKIGVEDSEFLEGGSSDGSKPASPCPWWDDAES